MERIFTNSLMPTRNMSKVSHELGEFARDDDAYQAAVTALVDDATDYNDSYLALEREVNNRYYYGLEPRLGDPEEVPYDSYDASPEGTITPAKNSVVSTDVRDTIMAVIPSLMRIFAGSEHSVDFQPRREGDDDMAKQATDYIRYKFWEDNDGFMILYSAIMDCLQNRIGVITWSSEDRTEWKTQEFRNITPQQLMGLLSENETAQVVNRPMRTATGLLDSVQVRYAVPQPSLQIDAVPLDEFRVSRTATKIKNARLIGREQYLPASDLIELGYDPELVYEFAGESRPHNSDLLLRNPHYDMEREDIFNDLVRYGDYYVRIDRDGDGIAEVRRICTMGNSAFIVDDTPVANVNYSVFSPDPRQHALIGNALADLAKDIQRINTNLIRGALDSLGQSINPRTAINEQLTNIEDALNDDLGAIIRTRGAPRDAVYPVVIPFVGADAFSMKEQMDRVRQARTGISEASKGVDPKALQSTAVMGIDLIANGAQERIELIARIIAETGLAPMYRGLLREVVDSQNPQETVKLRGKWVDVQPSTFDADMRCIVNPALGKGSDMTRLAALQEVKNTQLMIIDKFGIANPAVGPIEVRNTISDMLEIANIRNVSRYFREITPEVQQQIQTTPKEPDPMTLAAQAQLEKVKGDVVRTQAELDEKRDEARMKDDLERDRMTIRALVDLTGILAEFASAEVPEGAMAEVETLNTPEYNEAAE